MLSGRAQREKNWDNYNSINNKIFLKIALYKQKNRHINQWNRIESPEINAHVYGQKNIDTGTENIQWIKESLFIKRCWGNWKANAKE